MLTTDDLFADLATIIGEEMAKKAIRGLQALGGGTYYVRKMRTRQNLQLAIELFKQGGSRQAVVRRLMREGMSRANAYLVSSKALSLAGPR